MVKIPKNRIIVTIGVLIALLPLLGFPRAWESFFQVLAGLSIILLSVWATIDKKLTLKAKAQKRQQHKRQLAEMTGQSEESLGNEPSVVESDPI